MKKKLPNPIPINKSGIIKIVRTMKLALIIVSLSVLQVSANVYSQITVNLDVQDKSIREVLKSIEQQSQVRFFFSDDLLVMNERVDVKADNKNIIGVLDDLFSKSTLTYKAYENNLIVIVPRQLLQQQRITGTVTDKNGAPVTGANVVVTGTTLGAITDIAGKYSIEVPKGSKSLTFSFIGMEPQNITIGTSNLINVTMAEFAVGLEEVVVVGYGVQKKVNLTGAIAAVSSEELIKVSTNDITNNLTGRAPGLRVRQFSSEPGKYDSQIDIRGFSTGTLFIVDGVQRDKSGFDRLDPNEIESVSVLKDASAAIYGVKAANGVILVTTKKGKIGKLKISYSGQAGQQLITKYPEFCNAYQNATLYDEMQMNGFITGRLEHDQPKYSAQQIEDFRTGVTPSSDWIGLVLRNTAMQTQHNLIIQGGSDKIQYFASGGYFSEGGLYRSGDLGANKYNFRMNVRTKFAEGLDMGINVSFINSTSKALPTNTQQIIKTTMRTDPTEPIYANDNPLYLKEFLMGYEHPIALTTRSLSGYNDGNDRFITSTFDIKYNLPFVKGLSAKAQIAYDLNYSNDKQISTKYYQYTAVLDPLTNDYSYIPKVHNSPSTGNESFSQGTRNNIQLSLNYQNSFGSHNVSALLLYEQVLRKNKNFSSSTQFVIDAIDQLFAGDRTLDRIGSGYSESSNRSIVGRANYNYKGRYLAEFAFRYDGSSSFPKNSRWGFFPSASIGWRISEESFIKDNIGILTNLKLRGSIGRMGDDGAAAFQFLTGYTYPGTGYQFGTTWMSGLGFKNSANLNLTWYTSTTSDIGLDGVLWKGLLSLEFDIFRRDRDGLLATRLATLPATYGQNLPQENLNQDRTQGYEVVLGHKSHLGKFYYSLSANVSYSLTQNRYKEESPANGQYDYWKNRTAFRNQNVVFGYTALGQFQNFEQIYASPIQDGAGNRTVLPGNVIYKDINGDGIISAFDELPIGRNNSKPDMYFGFNLTGSFKGFDVAAFFQGATLNQQQFSGSLMKAFWWGDANPIADFYDRWHRADLFDYESEWIPGKWPSTGNDTRTSSFSRFDATYLRLKSLEVGYTLPKNISGKLGIESFRVFANGYDLLTWTMNSIKYIDPERPADPAYPIAKNLNIGIQCNF